ncbi:MAG: DUF2231 domain-containing protein [Gemmatimonadales bacterium]
MPDIGMLHPQIVHFVIALLYVGVIARIVSLVPPLAKRFAFAGPMAALLILIGTGAAVLAVKSGTDAHEKAESIPGVRTAVQLHEDAGHDTRNVFLVVALFEIGALALASRKAAIAKGLLVASALVGAVGLYFVFQVGDLGGDLVYEYAGGVGVRSGDTSDVRHLLVAGLYNNLRLDRQNHDKEAAARMADELVRRMPNDTTIRLLGIESMIRDKNDPRGALAALAQINAAPDNRRVLFRKATLTSDAYVAAGVIDSARMTLDALKAKYPQNAERVQQIIDKLPKETPAPAAPAATRRPRR